MLKRMLPLACFLVAAASYLTGCTTSQRILERLGPTQSAAYDLVPGEDGKAEPLLRVSITIPKSEPEIKEKRETQSVVARTSKEARLKIARKTDLNVVSGQIRNILFGKELAREQGLWKFIDTLVRDPSISQRVKVTIVENNANDLLLKDYPEHPRTGRYVDRMLTKESKMQTVPETTVYHFTRDLFDDGIDPVAPIIRDAGSHIEIMGIGLFNEDKLVGEVDTKKALIFSFIRGDFKQGEVSIHLGKEEIMFSSLVSNRDLKISRTGNGEFKATLRMTIKGSVLEYIGDRVLSEKSDREAIEKEVSAYIEKEALAMVRKMQRLNADSLGIGKRVRNGISHREWKSLDWRTVYPKIEVACSAKVTINNFGKFK